MSGNFTGPLHALKLGAPINLYFLASTLLSPPEGADPALLRSAQILFAVSAYRCLFPCRYKDNIVLHDSLLSSIFLTRLLATFAEIAFIFQFSTLLRRLNTSGIEWVDWLAWAMMLQVVLSQIFVWWAILSRRLVFYFYEEIGWFLMFLANTVASASLLANGEPSPAAAGLLQLNLLFGAFYLPWQILHLRSLRLDATSHQENDMVHGLPSTAVVAQAWKEAVFQRRVRQDADAWGGWIGLVWMVCYWATLIPLWAYHIATTNLS